MEKNLEKNRINFRRYRLTCLSLVTALICSFHSFAQSTGQPPKQVVYTINGQKGTNQTIVFDSTANAWAIVSAGNKHILKVPGVRLVTATGTINYLSKFSAANKLINSQVFDNGTNVGIGTSSPGYKLTVSGTGNITGDLTLGANAIIAAAPSSGNHATNKTYVDNNVNAKLDTSGVRGSSGYIPYFTATRSIRNSTIFQTGSNIGIGTITPTSRLSLGTFWDTANETVGINFKEGSVSGSLPAYGIGFGPASTEGYISYRSGTASSSIFGHKWIVNNTEVMRVRGDGNLGLGNNNPIASFHNSKLIAGAATSYGILVDGQVQSSAITSGRLYATTLNTASGFTLPNAFHFFAGQGTISGTVTSQTGFLASSTLAGAGTNIGFMGNVVSGTNNWNLYMPGTANNYLASKLGLGTTTLTNINLNNTLPLTGGISASSISNTGIVQSDVTSNAIYNNTSVGTQAASFTLANLIQYAAQQSTIGAGSTVTNQFGFWVGSSLIGATNNYGIYSAIPSGTGRWNLYMAGSADNYFAGSVGIGSTTTIGHNLNVSKNITGNGGTGIGIRAQGNVQSDVTNAYYIRSDASTQAASFTLSNLNHFTAVQGVIGAGSTVTNQTGIYIDGSLSGATNNFGIYSNIPASATNYNLYMASTANNFLNGNLGIGGTPGTYNLRIGKAITGAGTSIGLMIDGTVQAGGGITTAYYARSHASITTDLSSVVHFGAVQNTVSGTIGSQLGFSVASSLIGATNNYGFHSNIPSGTGRWNFYAAGTANNYFAGNIGIGTISPTYKLEVNGNIFANSNLVLQGAIANGSTIGFFDNTNTTTDQSFGLLVDAGTSVNDYVLRLRNAANTELFKVTGAGTANITGDFTFGANAIAATTPTTGNHLVNKTYADTKQPGDGDLTAIATLSGTGFSKRTGTDTWSLIALTIADIASLQSSLDAKQGLDGDLTALAALSSTGVAKRTGTDTWSVGALAISDITSLQNTLNTKLDSSSNSGTSDFIPKFTGNRTIRNSVIKEISGNIEIGSGTTNADLTVYGDQLAQGDINVIGKVGAFHFTGIGPTPSISAGTGLGTSPVATVTGSSTSLTIALQAGSSPSAGSDVVTINFNSPFTSTPRIVFSETSDHLYYNQDTSANTRDCSVYIASKTANSFKIRLKTNRVLIASASYTFDVHVIQ